jgi:hypothetical protein
VRIAANYLSPSARAEIIKLLKVDAGNNNAYYSQTCPKILALAKKSALTGAEANTFLSDGLACIASWADPPVKSQRKYTSNWHFVDVPVVRATSSNPTLTMFDETRDCKMDWESGDCAFLAVLRFEPIIGNYKNPLKKGHEWGEELTVRAEALKFYVHIIGDMHQPLHCATDKKDKDALDDPTDKGDMGGNGKNVSWFGDTDTFYGFMNLHSVWDGGIIEHTMQTSNWTESRYAQELFKAIPKDENNNLMGMRLGGYGAWITDSYKLAVSNAYGKLPKYDASCKMTFTDSKTKKVKTETGCYPLGADYYNINKPVVEEQLKLGGVHLAKQLNDIFKS